MLLKVAIVQGIVDGRITRVYRRWAAPRAKAGGRQRTHLGELAIDAVTAVDPAALTDADAHAAGHPSVSALQAALGGRPGTLYRIDIRFGGEDPRVALREAVPDAAGLEQIRAALARKDRRGPWTIATLTLIRDHEGVRAPDLAAMLGDDTKRFKRRVRQLKELGLTISLERGYRLSPRGRAVLDAG